MQKFIFNGMQNGKASIGDRLMIVRPHTYKGETVGIMDVPERDVDYVRKSEQFKSGLVEEITDEDLQGKAVMENVRKCFEDTPFTYEEYLTLKLLPTAAMELIRENVFDVRERFSQTDDTNIVVKEDPGPIGDFGQPIEEGGELGKYGQHQPDTDLGKFEGKAESQLSPEEILNSLEAPNVQSNDQGLDQGQGTDEGTQADEGNEGGGEGDVATAPAKTKKAKKK